MLQHFHVKTMKNHGFQLRVLLKINWSLSSSWKSNCKQSNGKTKLYELSDIESEHLSTTDFQVEQNIPSTEGVNVISSVTISEVHDETNQKSNEMSSNILKLNSVKGKPWSTFTGTSIRNSVSSSTFNNQNKQICSNNTINRAENKLSSNLKLMKVASIQSSNVASTKKSSISIDSSFKNNFIRMANSNKMDKKQQVTLPAFSSLH